MSLRGHLGSDSALLGKQRRRGLVAPLSQGPTSPLAEAMDAGSSATAAPCFGVGGSAAIKMVRRVQDTGSTAPAPIGGYGKPLLAVTGPATMRFISLIAST